MISIDYVMWPNILNEDFIAVVDNLEIIIAIETTATSVKAKQQTKNG